MEPQQQIHFIILETSEDTSVRTAGKVAYISFGGFNEAEEASTSSEDQQELQRPREDEAGGEPIKSFRSEKEEEFPKKNSDDEAQKGARRESKHQILREKSLERNKESLFELHSVSI